MKEFNKQGHSSPKTQNSLKALLSHNRGDHAAPSCEAFLGANATIAYSNFLLSVMTGCAVKKRSDFSDIANFQLLQHLKNNYRVNETLCQ